MSHASLQTDDWFAHTKLAPPALRSDTLHRHQLCAVLQQALATCPLTLLSAPAGAGKTTLIVDWLAATRQAAADTTFGVAWLSLDEDDNDPARFFTAVTAALRRGGLAHLPFPEGGAPAQLRRWSTHLINELPLVAGPPVVLILDDLHWVSDPAIFAALDQLIERLPPQLRLLATTRHDPPLSLARLRVRRQVAELHLGDLRFTTDETARWLATERQLELPADQIAALVERTEGWAAGISLFVNSLVQRHTPGDRNALFEELRHTDRTLFAFLAEEVLNRQEPFVRMFLLETAVLPHLTPALCRAVTGRADAQAVLDALYQRNLFLVELDAQPASADRHPAPLAERLRPAPAVYRYHDLFREFLNDRLRRELPDWPAQLCRRAAAAEPDPLRRMHLFLAGELWHEAAETIGQVGETLVQAGAFGLLQRCISALPAPVREGDPQLLLLGGICAWELYQLEPARGLLQRALLGFEERGDQAGRAEALARLALAANQTGDVATAREYTAQALSLPLAPEMQVQLLAARSLDLLQGDEWQVVLTDFDQALALIEAEHDPQRRRRLCFGMQRYMVGPLMPLPGALPRFERLERLLAEHDVTQDAGPLRLYQITMQIYIHRDRGRWDAALRLCDELYRQAAELGVQEWQAIMVGGIPPICHAVRGDMAAADDALEQLFVWIDRIPQAVVIQRIPYLYWRARVRWLQGRHAEVREHAAQIAHLRQTYGTPALVASVPPLLDGLIALAERRYRDAEGALRTAAAIQERQPFAVIFNHAHLLLAYAVLKRGRPDEALALLRPLLAHYEEADTPGRLLWEGPFTAALLRLAIERGQHPAFARRVLQLLEPSGVAPEAGATLSDSPERLSEREREVLRLMAAGASNSVIAERLIISPHTAKRHVANILSKLGVATRTEAAARARELDLI